MRMRWIVGAIVSAVLGCAVATPAQAICIACSCNVSPNPMTFGAFAPLDGAPLDNATSVGVSCTGIGALDSMTIRMNAGLNGTFAMRKMKAGANTLDYNLYADAARTQIWGDGTGGYSPVVVPNTLGLLSWTTNTPVYGRIPAAPGTRPGSYTDTIVVTVEW